MGRFTRGIPGAGAAAGGGITENDHENLDTLAHAIVEGSFAELTYTGKDLTNVTVWTDAGKTTKIREVQLSYTGKDLTGVVAIQYDGVGVESYRLTKTLAYDADKNLESVTVVRA